MMITTLLVSLSLAALALAYLWFANRAVSTAPAEALKLIQKPWTTEQLQDAYRKAQTSPTDVRPFLFAKKSRRYIVAGGSGIAPGLVGGWIVHHLLLRGEDPAAIRIIDLAAPTRKEVAEHNIAYIRTDVSDPEAVSKAFTTPWPETVRSLPLTVFHCIAYINPCDRHMEFLPIYLKITVNGTENILQSARAAGASCLIATSSASIALKAPIYFPWPWQTSRTKNNTWQFLPNADPDPTTYPRDDTLKPYGSCYSWSKARAEHLVLQANSPSSPSGLLTGCIRPGHAIYGHGVANPSSITWDYLRRGGSPSWIPWCVANFVAAQNVSIGHLAYEDAVLRDPAKAGRAFCVTDPTPPIQYAELYKALTTLAHPLTRIAFPYVPHMAVLLPAYVLEAYRLLKHRYLAFLPPLTGDIAFLQPAMFNMCALHIVYTDTAAQEEIGYRAPITTLEGFALAVLDWNTKIDEKVRVKVEQGMGGQVHVEDVNVVPKGPNVH